MGPKDVPRGRRTIGPLHLAFFPLLFIVSSTRRAIVLSCCSEGEERKKGEIKKQRIITRKLYLKKKGGGQVLERRNVERPIFRNLKIANIKITKDELFDGFIFEFNFSYFRTSFEHPKYLVFFF